MEQWEAQRQQMHLWFVTIMKKEDKNLSRRSFLKSSALAGTIGVIGGSGATGGNPL